MKKSMALAVSAMMFITTLLMTACSKEKTDQVVVNYIEPKNPAYLHIYTLFEEERHTLENLKVILSPFRLPWELKITLTECEGEADAMYWNGEITICYEYVEELLNYMPEDTSAAGIEPIDTVIGPFLDTLLHEFAHALFDYLDLPILGREEDAADQVSAYIYLHLGEAEARRLIVGTVLAYKLEVEDTDPPTMEEYADEHSTSEQRAFNLLCIAYGANPELFADVVAWGGLPQYRVEICEEEYEHIAFAIDTLIGPHVDPDLARKIYDKSWLPKKDSGMFHKRKLD